MIALPPPPETQEKKSEVIIQEERPEEGNTVNRNEHFFADEVKINDQTVLTIPVEKMFYEEEKTKRKSRWGAKAEKKKQSDKVFNPYEALTEDKPIQSITDQVLNKNKAPEEKKQSKWGPEYDKNFQPPPLHLIPKSLAMEEVEFVLRLYRLDELNRRIQSGQYENYDPDLRSPSPEPIYDPKSGQRVNTRENRAKENLNREKFNIIEDCLKMRGGFVPPPDYKPPKKSKKLFLPDSDMNETNYIGMIIGPRGITQKSLETKTGCKISIRGKGSNKYKKAEFDSDEKLHILMQADTEEQLEKCTAEVEKILRGDIEDNEFKKNQMYQLQVITGMVRDDYCENCHEKGHRGWACPNKKIPKIAIKCEICDERSHPTSDCPKKREGAVPQTKKPQTNGMEHEFAKFLIELEGGNKAKDLLALASQDRSENTARSAVSLRTNFLTDLSNPVLHLTNSPAFETIQTSRTPLASALSESLSSNPNVFLAIEQNNNAANSFQSSLLNKNSATVLSNNTPNTTTNNFNINNNRLNAMTGGLYSGAGSQTVAGALRSDVLTGNSVPLNLLPNPNEFTVTLPLPLNGLNMNNASFLSNPLLNSIQPLINSNTMSNPNVFPYNVNVQPNLLQNNNSNPNQFFLGNNQRR